MTRGHMNELLSGYLDEQVSPAERARIEAHLSQCAQCRSHLEALRSSVALVRGLDPVSAPSGFQEAVRAKVAESRPSQRGGRAWSLPRLSWKTAGVAAAALLVGIFSVNLLREMQPPEATLRSRSEVRQSDRGLQERTSANAPKDAARQAPFRAADPSPGEGAMTPPAASPAPFGPGVPIPPAGTIPGRRQIIRSAHVNLVVDNFDTAARRLIAIAEGAGGFVASSSSQSGERPEGTFVLRVPASRFSAVLEEIERMGTVEVRRVGGQDVTEEFVDLQSRVRNLDRHEQQLLSFMDRATKVSDLLSIEQELARVRGEIEMLTGRLRYLGSHVDLATLEVVIRQKSPKAGGFIWDFGSTLRRMSAAALATVRQILAGLESAAVLISALAPVLLLAGLGWLVVRRVRARTA